MEVSQHGLIILPIRNVEICDTEFFSLRPFAFLYITNIAREVLIPAQYSSAYRLKARRYDIRFLMRKFAKSLLN